MNKNDKQEQRSGAPEAPFSRSLDRLVRLARAALFWEKLWRALVPPLLVGGFFLAVSFAGLWLEVTGIWRIAGVAVFGLALAVSLLPFFRLRRPSRKEALSRIDRDSGIAHRPASAFDDALANAGDDPTTEALWALHRQRLARHVAALRAGLPSPRMVDFDRYALRAGVLVALIASIFVAGPEKYARVASAFDWSGAVAASTGYRIDAWIDPPPYTGRAPVLLKLGSAEAGSVDHPEKIAVPIGSTVIVRASGGTLRLEPQGGLEPAKPVGKADTPKSGKTAAAEPLPDNHEHRLVLRGDARLGIRRAGALLGLFDIAAIPDKPPRIELTDAPRANVRGSLTLSYKVADDYGATAAQANFADPAVEGANGRLRSLVAPPHIDLALPPGPGGLGETVMTADLSDHPWAGTRVKMTLTVHDEGGNEGESVPIEITLPQKHFVKPIARALAEQRRDLVLFPDDKGRVETALEALMVAPEVFSTPPSVYLGLIVASNMLRQAHADPGILATADFLWKMALQIENGDLSDAERELRAAEQQLREALQRNASDAEIRKLTENLRAAMDKFLNEFAQKQQRERNAQDQSPSGPKGSKSISRKDLQAMVDRMQEMSRAGDRASAQRMLEQLQNTLDNLAMAQKQQADPAQRAMNKALNQIDKMMRDQQDLRDETHRQGRNQRGQQQQGQGERRPGGQRPGEQSQDQQGGQRSGQARPGNQFGQGDQSGQDLRQRQQALRDRLEGLQKRLREAGQNEQSLDDAGRAMQEAEKALGKGGEEGNSAAVDAQGRALQALHRGAEQLAQQMQGQGNGQGGEGSPQAEQQGASDPLGRPMGGDPAFNPYSRYDPMGMPAAQRAQRVLEELRKRLSDPSRPREEMDYLERLLRRY